MGYTGIEAISKLPSTINSLKLSLLYILNEF